MTDNISELSSNLLGSERHSSFDSYAPRHQNGSKDSIAKDTTDKESVEIEFDQQDSCKSLTAQSPELIFVRR